MMLPRWTFSSSITLWFSILVILQVSSTSSPLHAQDWARKMFSTHEHDFGTVARGTEKSFRFEFTNLYKEDIHIASVRSSCGCAVASVEQDLLKTGETSAILTDFNSLVKGGQKKATITVVIDQPYYAEVQLIVHGHIRANTVFEPGQIQFGEVREGSKTAQTIRIAHYGNTGWQITDVRAQRFTSDQIRVGLQETYRSNGTVNYDMTVELQDSLAAGYLQGELNLVTNEGGDFRYPISFYANVTSALQLSPSLLTLGQLQPGQQVTHKVILKGEQPFRVTDVATTDQSMQIDFDSEKSNRLQILNVTYTAGAMVGSHECEATITTDIGNGTQAVFKAMATVVNGSP